MVRFEAHRRHPRQPMPMPLQRHPEGVVYVGFISLPHQELDGLSGVPLAAGLEKSTLTMLGSVEKP